MENINIAELLKNCPQGMELYSPLCGACVFDRLNMGTIICKTQNTEEITFTSEGYYMLPVFDDCECMLFPSKDQRDWNKFHTFKDGDIVFYDDTIAIFKEWGDETLFRTYVTKYLCNDFLIDINVPLLGKNVSKEIRLATEKEKQKLLDSIKDNGYKWNAETKTLEKLIKPKFKVGDVVQDKDGYKIEIIDIDKEYYWYISKIAKGVVKGISFKEQDDWELVNNKFDISTLVPYESRVLVRDHESHAWKPAIWGFLDENCGNHLYGVVGGNCFVMCIPFEGNEHLRGKIGDCDKFYQTWKE